MSTPDASQLPELHLKRHEDRRLRAGHAWVFSNEIDAERSPLTAFEPGSQARIVDAAGRPLGVAYVNPASLITARVVSLDPTVVLDEALLGRRLDAALALRERLGEGTSGRLVFGEGDRLPGLVVDRYGDVLVGQLTTAGMDRLAPTIARLLGEKTGARAMLWRNDVALRELEGLPLAVEAAFGTVPDRLAFEEAGLALSVDTARSQKTGWFFDQRANRERLSRYVGGARCLDLFSYAGGWGLQAARAGAAAVTCVDAGEQAIADLEGNVAASGLEAAIRIVRADVFQFLAQALADDERYDVIVLDPPAFAKRRKDVKPAIRAYERLNELALRLLADDGILATCSCSFHLREETFADVVARAARRAGRSLQRLERLQQAPDHPVHPAIPETEYLKGAILRATRA